MLQQLMQLDSGFLLWIQEVLRNRVLTAFFIFVTDLGNDGAIWIFASLLLMFSKRFKKVGILSLIALILAAIIDNVILKNLIARVRPYEVVQGLTSLIGTLNDYSFPSGHTGSSFASAMVLFCGLPKKYGVPALLLAALIGFSRLYVGVHYPTDVIGGVLIGSGIAIVVWVLGNVYIELKRIRAQRRI